MARRQIWLTAVDRIVIVHKIDGDLYYYEYAPDEYMLLEKSPLQYKMEWIGEL
jgi:hypothetical protein